LATFLLGLDMVGLRYYNAINGDRNVAIDFVVIKGVGCLCREER
jgi:hypothetical protein